TAPLKKWLKNFEINRVYDQYPNISTPFQYSNFPLFHHPNNPVIRPSSNLIVQLLKNHEQNNAN
ncbi:MAG TPA: hypothetical protein PLS94_13735, partial [Prolixibacteraceae bacterium]|nr:hypothetical protein [Prolixibacteraceae bacterium]